MSDEQNPATAAGETQPDAARREPPGHEDSGRREPVFNLPGVVLALIAACVGVHLVRMWLLTPAQDFEMILRFAFIPLRYSGGYALDVDAFLAPFTYAFMHGGLGHLAVNTIWLAAFGSPLANRIGAPRFLLFWAVTSLAAVALHYALHSTEAVPLIGASGAISGMMGAAARFGFRIDRASGRAAFAGRIMSIPAVFASRMVVTFLGVWFAVNLAMGLGFGASDDGSSIAWEAHIGGFLAGFLLIRAFDRPR
jgi:membrane associated rhomboid family serine protease